MAKIDYIKCPSCGMVINYNDALHQKCSYCGNENLMAEKASGSKVPCSGGLDNREVFANGLIELWPHLMRLTQLDVINRLRAQPQAMLKPMQLQILEANLKTQQG